MPEKPYNCKIYDYPAGLHVTLYEQRVDSKKAVLGYTPDTFCRNNQNEHRTPEQEAHCLQQSLRVTKQRVYHLARSNRWEYFVTFTFDQKRVDSSNYPLVVKKLTQFLNNLRKRKAPGLVYLIVPELHADGEHYHFHGLFAHTDGLSWEDSGKTDGEGNPIYNLPDWGWGFSTATRVADSGKVSAYITKYLTKEMCASLKNKKRYYASRNIGSVEEERYNLDTDQVLATCAEEISFIKTVDVPAAHQRVTYLELNREQAT